MNMINNLLVGSAGLAMVAGAAAPASAQYYPPSNNQGSGVVGTIIDTMLGGGRYGAYGRGNDRMAVDQCARAAEARVGGNGYGYDNRGYGQGAYQNDPRYGQAYGQEMGARVVAVTSVERRSNGLRVTGLIDTNNGYGGYDGRGYGQGQQYPGQSYGDPRYPQNAYPQATDPRYGGWNNQGYANAAQFAELRFNCRVDYRGQITRLNIERNNQVRRGY